MTDKKPIAKRLTVLRRAIRNFALGKDGTSGAVLIELAIIMPMLAVMIVYGIDVGFRIFHQMQVHHAAQAGAQYAIENPTPFSSANIASAVQNDANPSKYTISATPAPNKFCGCPSSTGVTSVTCSSTCADGLDAGVYVTVSAQATHNTVIPAYGFPESYTLNASATVRIQ